MQFHSGKNRLTLTKYEQATLQRAEGILRDAGRILGDREVGEIANMVGNGHRKLLSSKADLPLFGQSPSGDTSDPLAPSTKGK